MSPEFNFSIKMVVDLPSADEAEKTAESLSRTLVGVRQIIVSPTIIPVELSTVQVEPLAEGQVSEFQDNALEGLSFGETLRHLRETNGLTQRELGIKAGVDPTTLSRMERGSIHKPRSNTIYRIGRSLGWEPDDPRVKLLMERRPEKN